MKITNWIFSLGRVIASGNLLRLLNKKNVPLNVQNQLNTSVVIQQQSTDFHDKNSQNTKFSTRWFFPIGILGTIACYQYHQKYKAQAAPFSKLSNFLIPINKVNTQASDGVSEEPQQLQAFSIEAIALQLKEDNRYVIDLRSYFLTGSDFAQLYEWLKEEEQLTIGRILFRKEQDESSPLLTQINVLLASNRSHYIERPTPYVYAVLSQQAYENDGGKRLPEGWEVFQTSGKASDKTGYFGVAYRNKRLRHIIVAHRGTDPSHIQEFINDLQQDLTGVAHGRINEHEANANQFAEEIIRHGKGHGYKVSFAGHSLGGFLAQVCVYQAKRQGYETYAVVLDSPGAREHLQKCETPLATDARINLEKLDITSYLSAPNIVNTCHTHLGTVYRLYPVLPNFRWYKPYEYLLETHSKDRQVRCFDPVSGHPSQYREMVDWPKIAWSPVWNIGGVFSMLVRGLVDIAIGKTMEYQGAVEYASLGKDFDEKKYLDLPYFKQYQLYNAYHYRSREVNPQKMDCRHLPRALLIFLERYQEKGGMIAIDKLPQVQQLNIIDQLQSLLNYELRNYAGDGKQLILTGATKPNNVYSYREALGQLLNFYSELKEIDYNNYIRKLLDSNMLTVDLSLISQTVERQCEANRELLQKLAGLQIQARLYLYGEATSEELSQIESQDNAIGARLEDNFRLLAKLEDKDQTDKLSANLIKDLKAGLLSQQRQLKLAQQMNKVLYYQRLRRFKDAEGEIENILRELSQLSGAQKQQLFSLTFNEEQLQSSLYNLQAKIRRVLLPKEEWGKVKTSYDLAIQFRPKDATLHSSKGALLNDWGKHEEALSCHRSAEKLNKHLPIVQSNLGWGIYQIAKQKGELDAHKEEIMLCYEQSLKKAPYLAGTWYYQALLKKDCGNIDGALEDFRKALDIQPEHPKALYYRAELLFEQGEIEKAKVDVKKAYLALRDYIPDHREQKELLENLDKKLSKFKPS